MQTQDASGPQESIRRLLSEIEDFCRSSEMAESTFGRQAVNDGKLCQRLRTGKGITLNTVQKIQTFIHRNGSAVNPLNLSPGPRAYTMGSTITGDARTKTQQPAKAVQSEAPALNHSDSSKRRPFRFYDNRQKYLGFVNTCDEKWKVAERAAHELLHVQPVPPALRLFDAGVGDGSVLSYLLRATHQKFPTIPFFVVGKEISLEDVRLCLDNLPDRFAEHPASVICITNLFYNEAPWLMPGNMAAAAALNWHEISLQGSSAQEYGEQLRAIDNILVDGWEVKVSEKTGNPRYVRPSVLVIFREDNRFLLDSVIPRRGQVSGDYDLIVAAQPWRARMTAQFKVEKVLAPLIRSLGPVGRLLAVQSAGQDPGMELVNLIWPDENPFQVNRHDLLKVLKDKLGRAAANYNFNAGSDNKSILRYEMKTLPTEIAESIGTSTLFAAWNASTYVAQIEDDRLQPAVASGAYLEATQQILHKHNGLWFNDETFVVSRRRNSLSHGPTQSSVKNSVSSPTIGDNPGRS